MKKVVLNYEIVNHGIDNEQYFSGCGTSFTEFDRVVTGMGQTEQEAFDDAMECLYESEDGLEVCNRLEREKGTLRTEHGCDIEGLHCYVSIRYNLMQLS